MTERIIQIIRKLPIIKEVKKVLIENIEQIDQEQLIEILWKYADRNQEISIRVKNSENRLRKSFLDFENTKANLEDESELETILGKLEEIYL